MSAQTSKKKEKTEDPIVQLGNRGLHEVLTQTKIQNIRNVFFQNPNRQLNPSQLKNALLNQGKLQIDDAKFDLMFLRINIKRDGFVTWDEFVSHLILGFKTQEVSQKVKALEPPINKRPKIIRSNHRHPIRSINFNFQVKPDRSYSFSDGSYITASKDGFINYWSLDMQVERTVQSKCLSLSVNDTFVLAVACLPDVSVIVTSSTERDLRFYDTSARKFELRVQITSLEYAVTAMHYVFHKDINEGSKVLLGDMGGNVMILIFSPINRGPFRSKLGIPLLKVNYDQVLKGFEPGFRLVEFKDQHRDWVRQVEYYPTLNFIVSCSSSSKAMVMRDINENRGIYVFTILTGAWCFAMAEGFPMIATGGRDCSVRIWNPYVTKRPIVALIGHHTGITSIILQDRGEYMCTMSEDKCIKVWDVPAQTCVQSYFGLTSDIGDHIDLTMFYNPESRQLIIGGLMIAILPLRPLPNAEHTDGNSHADAVSVLLYNPLFKIILTCGLDSFIIVWDPWSGRRISVVRNAHTRMLHGEIIPVDITAGVFDPGYQLLLTGAFDGSLKTWNFNTGTCLRNMRIESGCEVTGVCWVKGRIMAIGWNRHVTEFADHGGFAGPGGAFSKNWSKRHTDDVLCAAARIPQTLATSTYNGELILWRLETGQPYKQFSVANPTSRIKISYDFVKKSKIVTPKTTGKTLTSIRLEKLKRIGETKVEKVIEEVEVKKNVALKSAQPEIQMVLKYARTKPIVLPPSITPIRGLAVRCMIFLQSRPMKVNVATLFVALENGDVQYWSHHVSGGFIGAFQAVHALGDYIVSMATDEQNEYLFLGSTEGYIKTFLMKDFYNDKEEKICKPIYRLRFPFLWKRFIESRAKRALIYQEKPWLLNSYKAHRAIVSGLSYIDETEIIVSTSADHSVRLWTLGGRYLGTLGTFKRWVPIDPEKPVNQDRIFTIPPDIKRVMSSTTFRVFMGYDYEKPLSKKQEAAQVEKDLIYKYKEGSKGVYGKKLEEPYLGNYIRLPEKNTQKFEITLDTSFPYIPVYQHLIRPLPSATPEVVSAKKSASKQEAVKSISAVGENYRFSIEEPAQPSKGNHSHLTVHICTPPPTLPTNS